MQHIYGIYKPKGPTSHDIINQIRRITNMRKVGHAGTLDPLASGVLVVAIGREGTRELGNIVKHEKEYIATIKLGQTSATDDEEGEKTQKYTADAKSADIDEEKIKKVLKQFVGEIQQIPPVYSAIKIHGKPAYKRTRAGEEIKMQARNVIIKSIDILDYSWPILKIKVVCGSGVYIRSLARDIGEQLDVGGYLADLERTRVGDFTKEKSLTLEQLEKLNLQFS